MSLPANQLHDHQWSVAKSSNAANLDGDPSSDEDAFCRQEERTRIDNDSDTCLLVLCMHLLISRVSYFINLSIAGGRFTQVLSRAWADARFASLSIWLGKQFMLEKIGSFGGRCIFLCRESYA